jgi:cysteine sulfinate desulfinase/cysteine desulfurase-like protein
MGVPPEVGLGAVRFSIGRPTTIEDVEEAVQAIGEVLSRMSPAQGARLVRP